MLKISHIRDVPIPRRGTPESAGLDVHIPLMDQKFIDDFTMKNAPKEARIVKGVILIQPRGKVMIPTGLRVIIEPNTALFVCNKSGVAWKKGLGYLAHVIDSDYRGELFITLSNHTDHIQEFSEGEKIAQLVHLPIIMDEVEVISNEEYEKENTVRGDGALGSTGTHA